MLAFSLSAHTFDYSLTRFKTERPDQFGELGVRLPQQVFERRPRTGVDSATRRWSDGDEFERARHDRPEWRLGPAVRNESEHVRRQANRAGFAAE